MTRLGRGLVDLDGPRSDLTPFHTYIWKIASRCNLDCTYCYVYSSADDRWRRQPRLMSREVARQAARRIREHCVRHGKTEAVVLFHGGEPLMGGLAHLRGLTAVLHEVFDSSGIRLTVGMQSNGLLFTPELGDLFLAEGVSIGISLDGPPRVNDLARVDRAHRPTSARLEDRLRLLTSAPYRRVFGGFLCVINPLSDPVEVTDYLLGWDPPGIDFLFPLDNHDRRPLGKELDVGAAPYGEWLVAAFDHYWTHAGSTSIRIFDSIIRLLAGASSFVESLGLDPVDLVVVETNGEIEAVDALKSAYEGATALGYNVFDHDFDRAARDVAVRRRQLGAAELCQHCQECPVVSVCGGGYLPHRYSAARGFDNPSVYSADLERLIRHIDGVVATELRAGPASRRDGQLAAAP